MIAKIPGIDVVVGGHSYTLLSNTDDKAEGPYPTMVDNPGRLQGPGDAGRVLFASISASSPSIFDDNGVVK